MLREEAFITIDKIPNKCHYKGQVNSSNKPNGIGRAVDKDGHIFEGIFENGGLSAPNLKISDTSGWEFILLMDENGHKYNIRLNKGKFVSAQRLPGKGEK